ncbi:hypothetical protein [Magnetospirillum sp. UT-4]|uniref:hypothetical protein n=1 Tax=Magnetospirillum sp. UT-4 TaxID=2681467 RepID=UPI001572360E|nr:hypothetical protein [Magnetospirillum sp. UT-4]
MDIANIAAMAMAMQRAEAAQQLSLQMTKQAAQQDAAVLQLATAATQNAKSAGTAGQLLDISV